MTRFRSERALGCRSVLVKDGRTAEKVPALDGAFSGLIESQPMPRRISILIHTLAVGIISAIAWWHHDPALVLAYVSGALIEWEMTT